MCRIGGGAIELFVESTFCFALDSAICGLDSSVDFGVDCAFNKLIKSSAKIALIIVCHHLRFCAVD